MFLKRIFTTVFLFIFTFSSLFADESVLNEQTEQVWKNFIVEDSKSTSQKNNSWVLGENNSNSSWSIEENWTGSTKDTWSWSSESTQTWAMENNNSNSWVTEDVLKNFEIKNTFQSPTYLLDKDEQKGEYICDETQKDCKVNFDFRASFDETFKAKDFSCEIIFWTEKIENCNPNTLVFNEKETEIKVKIFLKKDKNTFKEKTIKILNKAKNWSNWWNETWSWSSESTQTWATENNNSNSWVTEDVLKNFEIKNTFQSPTYLLDKDEQKDEYVCDETQKDCKVNFDFRPSFDETFKAKDFSCEIEVWDEFIENCNPNTINFFEPETEVKIKIFLKSENNIFKEKIIKILKKDWQDSQQESSENNWQTQEEEKDNSKNDDFLNKFEIKNIFQSPSNLLEKEENKEIYNCETTKECKVNFDFRGSFDTEFKARNHICELSFWDQKIENCNPKTITLPTGSTEFIFRVYKKSDKNIFKEKKIIIINENLQTSNYEVFVPQAKIRVESWILNGKCEKQNCKVNFIFENKNRNLKCVWKFWEGEFKAWTENRCNPWIVTFPYGKHLITLRVYNKKDESHFTEDYFEFENPFEPEELEAKIELDWVSKKYQKTKNLAICYWTSKCKLNFSAKNLWKKIEKYLWDFWNWEIFEWKNPKTIEFLEWKHKVSLKIFDNKNNSKEYFFDVEVTKNEEESILKKLFWKRKEDENLKVKITKAQNNFNISWNNDRNILINKTFDFPLLWRFIHNEKYYVNIDELWNFQQSSAYDRAWRYKLEFYEKDDEWNINFLKEKDVEISYKNELNATLSQIQKEAKEEIKQQKEFQKIQKKLEKKEKVTKKQEKEKYLKIILQWKLTKNKKIDWKKIICNWPCSLNFSAETNIKSKEIFWDLWNWEKFNWKNPKTVKYEPGKYKAQVSYTWENWTISDYFDIEVSKVVKKTRKKRASKSRKSKKTKVWPVVLKITVQWRIWKTKILEENKLTCLGTTCSVNFDWRKSSWAYKELVWDFWNGEKFIWENPKSVKYKEFWTYKVSLKTEDFKWKTYEKFFEVEFRKKQNISKNIEQKSKSEKKEEIIEKWLKKEDIFFIVLIIFLILTWSFVLLKKYKIF